MTWRRATLGVRERPSLTQDQLAGRTGMSNTYISRPAIAVSAGAALFACSKLIAAPATPPDRRLDGLD